MKLDDHVWTPNTIFVFGSNLAGRHGAGAALFARKHCGAEYRNGVGIQGSSYAIPTKDKTLGVLPLSTIKTYVDDFILFATEHPELTFFVTKIGCGYAGYTDSDIQPMFVGSPSNCILPPDWIEKL